jgi:hypothetical protein
VIKVNFVITVISPVVVRLIPVITIRTVPYAGSVIMRNLGPRTFTA